MSNLSSLVDFIKKSKADFKTGHYIAQVVSPTEVRLFSSLDADRQRETLAVVKAEIPEFSFGQFIEADGGAWKNEAKANIKAYLEKELADVSNIFVIS